MTRVWLYFVAIASFIIPILNAQETPAPAPANAIATAPPAPADFKLVISLFGIRKPPIARSEVVVHNGVAFQFVTNAADEVTIIDPFRGRLHLLDLERKVQTEISAAQLDAAVERIHEKVAATIDRLEQKGGKANQIAATINRNLIHPDFTMTYDAGSHHIRLINPNLEIDVSGQAETDRLRLNMIINCLGALVKLTALREPDNMPPFARLDAFREIAARDGYRPTGIDILYRLSGPPKRLRWTYELVPTLTDREREAINRVDAMRASVKFLPFERYEETAEKP